MGSLHGEDGGLCYEEYFSHLSPNKSAKQGLNVD